MKTLVFMFLATGLLTGVRAQTTNAPDSTPPPDAAKVAEYQRRFQEGYALEQQGQLEQARTIYDGILAEQPEAKRSLLEAGQISLELNEPQKADAYLEKLHEIVPDFPKAYELLIQANEALKRDVKVERLVREFRALYDSRTVSGFDQPFFEREHLRLGAGQEIVVYQFFDYTKPPFYAVKVELLAPQHVMQRELLLKFDPEGTAELHTKDPAATNGNVFIVAEPFFANGRMNRIDVYQELFTTPDYQKARNVLLGILSNTPKPVYSAPVDAPAE
jgi:tetratricopeptide (TPR) repeat protein